MPVDQVWFSVSDGLGRTQRKPQKLTFFVLRFPLTSCSSAESHLTISRTFLRVTSQTGHDNIFNNLLLSFRFHGTIKKKKLSVPDASRQAQTIILPPLFFHRWDKVSILMWCIPCSKQHTCPLNQTVLFCSHSSQALWLVYVIVSKLQTWSGMI